MGQADEGSLGHLGALWNAGVRLRCPACGRGALFEQWISARDTCAACGQALRMGNGDFTGGVYLNYGITGLLGFLLFLQLEHAGYSEGQEIAVLIAFVTLLPLVTYRHTRAVFLAMLYRAGSLHHATP